MNRFYKMNLSIAMIMKVLQILADCIQCDKCVNACPKNVMGYDIINFDEFSDQEDEEEKQVKFHVIL